MTKINNYLLAIFCSLALLSVFSGNSFAQKRKQPVKKKQPVKAEIRRIEVGGIGSGSIAEIKREPYLGLEPCAKETPEQIVEVENAADKNAQLEILVKRIGDKDEWLRACSIYRLGEFRAAAQNTLPVIIKLLRDEENYTLWGHAQTALWKIPPDKNIPLSERIKMSLNGDVYQRLYGVYSLGYFRPIAGTHQSDDILNTLLETAKDDDTTVSWLSVMCIRQLGFYGINTSIAIPVFSDIIRNKKVNTEIVVMAIIPMREKALPAVPLLFDILYNPKKYLSEKDQDQSYGLYLTTAAALGKIGKSIVPLLDKEIEREPFAVLQVLEYVSAEGTLPIIFKAMKNKNPKVRKTAIESLPGLTSFGAIQTIPHLLTAVNDINPEVRKSAISEIGNITKYTENKSPELKAILKKKAIPALILKLKNKENSCYAAMMLGYFGADAEVAIPALVRLTKKTNGDGCAERGLFDIGEKGKKFLTEERIKQIEKSKNYRYDSDLNKAKPIKPKEEPKPSPPIKEREG